MNFIVSFLNSNKDVNSSVHAIVFILGLRVLRVWTDLNSKLLSLERSDNSVVQNGRELRDFGSQPYSPNRSVTTILLISCWVLHNRIYLITFECSASYCIPALACRSSLFRLDLEIASLFLRHKNESTTFVQQQPSGLCILTMIHLLLVNSEP